jgi:hypothetical protein
MCLPRVKKRFLLIFFFFFFPAIFWGGFLDFFLFLFCFFRGLVRFGFVGLSGVLVFRGFLGDWGLNPSNAGSLYLLVSNIFRGTLINEGYMLCDATTLRGVINVDMSGEKPNND